MNKGHNKQDERKYTVYLHVVPKQISGYKWDKYYVGITSKNVNERWGGTGWGYLSQPYFYRAIQKYKWGNMRHLILKTNLSEQEAIEWEINYIRIYNSHNSIYGYNLTDGGDGTNGMKHSKATKNKMSKDRSGSNNSFYGRKHSAKTRELISLHHAPCSGGNNPKSKKAFQFTLDGNFIKVYPSCTAAARAMGAKTPSSIDSCCRGEHKTSYGYLWREEKDIMYVEKDDTYIIINNPYPRFKERKAI